MARSRLRTKFGSEFGGFGPPGGGGGGSAPRGGGGFASMARTAAARQIAAMPHAAAPPMHQTYQVVQAATPVGIGPSMGEILAAKTGLNAPAPQTPPMPIPDAPIPGASPPPMPDGGGEGGGGGGDQAPPPTAADDGGGEQYSDAAPPIPADVAPDDGGYIDEGPPAEAEIPADGEDPGVQNADYYGDPEVVKLEPFPLVNSFVRNGQLRTMAVLNTQDGAIPLTALVPIMGYEVSDGYVNFGADSQPTGVDRAVHTTRGILVEQAQRERVRLECESLVRRSRQGDQNATALLSQMAENAKKGDPRARLAYTFARTYIRANPAGADIGAESSAKKLSYWTAVSMANGAPLTKARIGSLAGSFARPEDVEVFLHGLLNFREPAKLLAVSKALDSYKQKLLDLGRSVGEARALQIARKPGVPLRLYDKAVAWELGE